MTEKIDQLFTQLTKNQIKEQLLANESPDNKNLRLEFFSILNDYLKQIRSI